MTHKRKQFDDLFNEPVSTKNKVQKLSINSTDTLDKSSEYITTCISNLLTKLNDDNACKHFLKTFYGIIDSILQLAYMLKLNPNLPLSAPRIQYWDENAQIISGEEVPDHVDPYNYPYYYWQYLKQTMED